MRRVRENLLELGIVKRAGKPEDIAAACSYLVSEAAGYVTGQTISVNGGRYLV
jgi:2-hydroxycyclohexanecarboxyl-CoA dehydrogenase